MDKSEATQVGEALRSRRHNLFLDFDHDEGIALGSDWEQRIYGALGRSDLLVVVLSPNWVASKWCFVEYAFARSRRIPIIPIIIASSPGAPNFELQGVNLCDTRWLADLDAWLEKLAMEAMPGRRVDRSRLPYPGLEGFSRLDAAIFFGRDAEARTLRRKADELSAVRVESQALVIVGPSGSGKSSLLKAGLLAMLTAPGLERRWSVLEVTRPSEIAAAPEKDLLLRSGLGIPAPDSVGDFEQAVKQAVDLLAVGKSEFFSVLLPVDQLEEALALDQESRDRVFNALARLQSADPRIQVVATLRSDSLAEVQRQRPFADRMSLFPVVPPSQEQFESIIRGPARLHDIEMADDLVRKAIEDAGGSDALPLLACALRQMYEFSPDARLFELADYQRLGDPANGLSPIDNAVRRLGQEAETGATETELAALRGIFVHLLVSVNEAGEFVRRPCSLDDIPASTRALVAKLVDLRVLRTDGGQVEVAHEAVLRHWPLVSDWLRSEVSTIQRVSSLRRAAASWRMQTGKGSDATLEHGGAAFQAVNTLLIPETLASLDADTRAYIDVCRASWIRHKTAEHVSRKPFLNSSIIFPAATTAGATLLLLVMAVTRPLMGVAGLALLFAALGLATAFWYMSAELETSSLEARRAARLKTKAGSFLAGNRRVAARWLSAVPIELRPTNVIFDQFTVSMIASTIAVAAALVGLSMLIHLNADFVLFAWEGVSRVADAFYRRLSETPLSLWGAFEYAIAVVSAGLAFAILWMTALNIALYDKILNRLWAGARILYRRAYEWLPTASSLETALGPAWKQIGRFRRRRVVGYPWMQVRARLLSLVWILPFIAWPALLCLDLSEGIIAMPGDYVAAPQAAVVWDLLAILLACVLCFVPCAATLRYGWSHYRLLIWQNVIRTSTRYATTLIRSFLVAAVIGGLAVFVSREVVAALKSPALIPALEPFLSLVASWVDAIGRPMTAREGVAVTPVDYVLALAGLSLVAIPMLAAFQLLSVAGAAAGLEQGSWRWRRPLWFLTGIEMRPGEVKKAE